MQATDIETPAPQPKANARPRLALGIETSCDESSVAIVGEDKKVHCNLIYSQIEEHRLFRGVVPEIAARAHLQKLPALYREAMEQTGFTLNDIDLIAATAGPGLIGGLHVGLQFAKGLALTSQTPLAAINHLEGHALTPRLVAEVAFPYLLLLVSGGHCQILVCEGVGSYRRWGTTLDDAAGEAFDKVAKMLDLAYPGGPALEREAQKGEARRFQFKTPMSTKDHAKSCDFSFSGLKTAVRRQIELLGGREAMSDQDVCDVCLAFQNAVTKTLAKRCDNAIKRFQSTFGHTPDLVVSGGVAANKAIISALGGLAEQHKTRIEAPPLSLCTDNAAMIAWAGLERAALCEQDDLRVEARPRWPLDPDAQKSIYAGAAKA